MHKTIIIGFLFSFSIIACSQSHNKELSKEKIFLNKADSLNIERAKKVVNNCITNHYSNYVLFSIGDKILLVEQKNQDYIFSHFTEKFDFNEQKNVIVRDTVYNQSQESQLEKVFSKNICNEKFKYSNTDDFSKENTHSHAEHLYFLQVLNGSKECELSIPTLYTSDVSKKRIIPIEQEGLNFLIETNLGTRDKSIRFYRRLATLFFPKILTPIFILLFHLFTILNS